MIYPVELLALLLAAVLVLTVFVIVAAARSNSQQRAYRAMIEVRENAEMEKALSEIKELYDHAREEVERLGT